MALKEIKYTPNLLALCLTRYFSVFFILTISLNVFSKTPGSVKESVHDNYITTLSNNLCKQHIKKEPQMSEFWDIYSSVKDIWGDIDDKSGVFFTLSRGVDKEIENNVILVTVQFSDDSKRVIENSEVLIRFKSGTVKRFKIDAPFNDLGNFNFEIDCQKHPKIYTEFIETIKVNCLRGLQTINLKESSSQQIQQAAKCLLSI